MPRNPKPSSPEKGHDAAKAKRKKTAAPKVSAKPGQKGPAGKKASGKAKGATKQKAAPAAMPVGEEVPPKRGRGAPTAYKPEYATIARKMCSMGATDSDLAQAFDVTVVTIWRWQTEHQEFCSALKVEKGEFDERVKRSLAQRAVGYSYNAVKIFMPAGASEPVYAPYVEHVPPDPGAAKIWLCNRQPEEWRDRKEFTGKDGAPLVPVLNVTYGDGRSGQSEPAPAAG